MPKSSLSELEAVLVIARCGKFRAAAIELGVSTTALSSSVGKLERTLGVRLFNRTTRSVSLTEAGEQFVAQIAPALRDIHEAMDLARSRQATPSGTLRINAFPTAAREIFESIVLPFVRDHPQVHVDIVTEGRMVDIVAGGFDFGVRSSDRVPVDMIALRLGFARRNVVVASPTYLAARGTPMTPEDLSKHACLRVRLPNGAIHRWPFEKDGHELKVRTEGQLVFNAIDMIVEGAIAGLGLSYQPQMIVQDHLDAGRLVQVLPEWSQALPGYHLYYPSRRQPTPAFTLLVNALRYRR